MAVVRVTLNVVLSPFVNVIVDPADDAVMRPLKGNEEVEAKDALVAVSEEIALLAVVAKEAVVVNTLVVALKVSAALSTSTDLAPVVPSVNAT